MTFPPIFLGNLIESVGAGMLALTMYREDKPAIFGMMALVGFGMGVRLMPASLHGVGRFRKDRAAVIGLLSVSVPLGGTIGLTIMSTVFNNTSGIGTSVDFSVHGGELPDVSGGQVHKAKVRGILRVRGSGFPANDGIDGRRLGLCGNHPNHLRCKHSNILGSPRPWWLTAHRPGSARSFLEMSRSVMVMGQTTRELTIPSPRDLSSSQFSEASA